MSEPAPDLPPVRSVELTVNGVAARLDVEPRETLLDVLRDRLDLTGTKAVCTMGNCGACTVTVDGRAVYACLVLGVECDGAEIGTIEGVADGDELHPVQRAFVERDAFQCGYCTPGQVMSLKAMLDACERGGASATEADVRRAVSGNLCRCGAYRHIVEAGRPASGLEPETSSPATSARELAGSDA